MNYWTGMFRFPPMQSPIDILLAKDGCTLEDLLDEEDFGQEIKNNGDLVAFCSEPDALRRIVAYATLDYPAGVDAARCEKYHAVCAALFGDDPAKVADAVAVSSDIVAYLFDAVRGTDTARVAAAAQIVAAVVGSPGSVVYEMFTADNTMLDAVMAHQDLTGALDIVLQIMRLEDAGKSGCIDWVCSRGFIPRILKALADGGSVDAVGNIAALVHSIVLWKVSSVDSPAVEFITRFNAEPSLGEFVDAVFESTDDFVVEQCFRIISNVLACSTVLTYPDGDTLPGIFTALLPHVSDFDKIFGEQRVGSVTNNLVYIVLSLVLSGFPTVYDAIASGRVLPAMVDMFYGSHLATVVRQTVQMTIQSIVNGNVGVLKTRLVDGGRTLKLMMEKDKEGQNEKDEKNIGPDYWLIGAQLMMSIVHGAEEKGESTEYGRIVLSLFMQCMNALTPRRQGVC